MSAPDRTEPAAVKWYRQDAHESSREWFLRMEPEARLAWRMLKDYVCQAHLSQKRAGVAPALTAWVAGRRWDLTEASVAAMLDAAQREGLLVVTETEWRVVDPAVFQSESASRVRRLRDCNAQPVTTPQEAAQPVPDADCNAQPVTPVARQLHLQPHTEPTVLIDGEAVSPRSAPKSSSSPDTPETSGERHELARRTLTALHVLMGKTKPPKDEDVHKLAVTNRGLVPLARDLGPDRAAEIYDYAVRTYGVARGWPFANEKRDELAREMEQGRAFAPRQGSPPGSSLPVRPSAPPTPRDQTLGALRLLEQQSA